MRSDRIKRRFERAPHRALLKATGVIQSDDDFHGQFIAIANSYADIIPGHVHLKEFGEVVRRRITTSRTSIGPAVSRPSSGSLRSGRGSCISTR